MSRKPQYNAWYAALTVEQGDAALKICDEVGLAKAGAAIATALQLSRDPSQTSVHQFYHRWPFRKAFLLAGDLTSSVEEMLQENPNLDKKRVEEVGQAVFTAASVRLQNPKEFARMKQLSQRDRELDINAKSTDAKARQKDAQIDLEKRRVELLEKKAAQADAAKAVVQNKVLTPEERAARMREIFGVA